MSKCGVIVSGGTVQEAFLQKQLQNWEAYYLIAVDKGLTSCYRLGIVPDLIVGDFDSLSKELLEYYTKETTIPIREFCPEKDASDTEIGVRAALEAGCDSIYLFGATGTRLDHVLANIQVLSIPLSHGVFAEILDPYNRIRLIQSETVLKKEELFGPYFSVFPLGGVVPHFSIAGAKYPLQDHTLCPFDSLCVSNQAAEDEVRISFPEGIVILMETRDTSAVLEN